MHITDHTGRVPLALVLVLSLSGVTLAHAETISLAWDPSGGTVSGYVVYIGSSQRIDVGNTTSYSIATAVPGQRYCFAVSAYNARGEGPRSGQVCGYSDAFPTLTRPPDQSSTIGQSVSLQLVGSDPDGLPISFTATGLPPGLFLGWATGFISGTVTTPGTYTVTARVHDGVLQSASQSFKWSVGSQRASDTAAPVISIATPTSAASYTTSGSTVSLSGTSSDTVGVVSVSWANNRGGSGVAVGTTKWSAASIGLHDGTNVITLTARDGAGNAGADVLTVTKSASQTSSTPTVTISAPTTASTYVTTSSVLKISGTASAKAGITQVTWVTDRGAAGTASGTSSWSASNVVLQSGANVVTVTARDAAGNRSSDVLTVTYNTSDQTAPAISIAGPTSASTYSTKSSVIALKGTSSDNRGVTAVTWANNRGGSGTSSGTTSWSVPSVALQGGTNVITVTARDAAGNRATDTLTVTYATSDTTPPTVTISSPTSLSGYSTKSSSLAFAGSATDNVGVTQVTWANDRGGSGVATGLGKWSVSSVPLQIGTNVITVRARDAAGNQRTDVLTATRR